MGDVVIRRASCDDLDRLYEIDYWGWDGVSHLQLLELRHGKLCEKSWRELRSERARRHHENSLPNVLVAEVDGHVAGYVDFSLNQETRVGEITGLCVDRNFRGRGIATKLVAAALDEMRRAGMRIATVTTFVHDLPARRVYEKNGYRELARSVHYSMEL